MSNLAMRIAVAILMLTLIAPVLAQTPAATPRFEAASVKPSGRPDPGIGGFFARGGRFERTNAPALYYVEQAFTLPPTRIVGIPDWMWQERFDITATYDQALGKSVPQMLQRLLEERFRLVARRETREIPVYELVPVRADGLVPRVRPTAVDCRVADGTSSPCRMLIAPGRINAVGMAWQGVPINLGITDRPIVDRTGLSGLVDITLEWLPEPGLATDAGERPSLFTALQEQLGLKLQPARVPMEVLVIDRIERPTPD